MAKNTIQSVEPNIADLANGWLKSYKLDYKLEQESLNTEIDKALNNYFCEDQRCACGNKQQSGNSSAKLHTLYEQLRKTP